METLHLMALANFGLWVSVAFVCICRLNASHIKVQVRVRFKYVILLSGALTSAGQPLLFHEWPGKADLVVGAVVLVYLLCNTQRWRGGPPVETLSRPAGLS